jgi:hypothetical protein
VLLLGYTNPSSNAKECQQGISGTVTMGGFKPTFLVIVLRNANNLLVLKTSYTKGLSYTRKVNTREGWKVIPPCRGMS